MYIYIYVNRQKSSRQQTPSMTDGAAPLQLRAMREPQGPPSTHLLQ